jgi:hypothetical protein
MHVALPPKTHASQEWARPPRAEWAEKWANWALNESIIRSICRVARPVRGLSPGKGGHRGGGESADPIFFERIVLIHS